MDPARSHPSQVSTLVNRITSAYGKGAASNEQFARTPEERAERAGTVEGEMGPTVARLFQSFAIAEQSQPSPPPLPRHVSVEVRHSSPDCLSLPWLRSLSEPARGVDWLVGIASRGRLQGRARYSRLGSCSE